MPSGLGVWGSPAALPRSPGKLGSFLCQDPSTQGRWEWRQWWSHLCCHTRMREGMQVGCLSIPHKGEALSTSGKCLPQDPRAGQGRALPSATWGGQAPRAWTRESPKYKVKCKHRLWNTGGRRLAVPLCTCALTRPLWGQGSGYMRMAASRRGLWLWHRREGLPAWLWRWLQCGEALWMKSPPGVSDSPKLIGALLSVMGLMVPS